MRIPLILFLFASLLACNAANTAGTAGLGGADGSGGSQGSGSGNGGGEDEPGGQDGSPAPRTDFVAPRTSASPVPAGAVRPFSLTLTCSDDGGACAKTFWEIQGSGLGMAEYTAPIELSVSVTVRFYSTDAANNQEAPQSLSVMIDDAPPILSAQSPATDALSVPIEATVSLRFDEPLSADGVMGACALSPTTAVTESYDPSTSTLYLIPTLSLLPAQVYTLSCNTGSLMDLAGNVFVGPLSTSFTTVQPDRTAPHTSYSPTSPLSAFTLTLSCSDGGSGCVETFVASGTGPTSSYTAPIAITGSTTVTFFSVDQAGNSEAPQIVTFTLDTTAPSVLSVFPVDAAVGVDPLTIPSLSFDEPIAAITCSVNGVPHSTIIAQDTVYIPVEAPWPKRGEPVKVSCVNVGDAAGNSRAAAGDWMFALAGPVREQLSPAGSARYSPAEFVMNASGEGAAFFVAETADTRELYVAGFKNGSWAEARLVSTHYTSGAQLADPLGGSVGLLETGAGDSFAYVSYIAFGPNTGAYLARVDLSDPAGAPVITTLSSSSQARNFGIVQRSSADLSAIFSDGTTLRAAVVNVSNGTVLPPIAPTGGLPAPGICQSRARASDYVLACSYPGNEHHLWHFLPSNFDSSDFGTSERLNGPTGLTGGNGEIPVLRAQSSHDNFIVAWPRGTNIHARVNSAGVWDPPLASAPTLINPGAQIALSRIDLFDDVFAGPNHFAISWKSSADSFVRRYRSGTWEPMVPLTAPSGMVLTGTRLCPGAGDDFAVIWSEPELHARVAPAGAGLGPELTLFPSDGIMGSLRCFSEGTGAPSFGFKSTFGAFVGRFDVATASVSMQLVGNAELGAASPRCVAGAGLALDCLIPEGRSLTHKQRLASGVWTDTLGSIDAPARPGQRNLLSSHTNTNGEGLLMLSEQDGQLDSPSALYFAADATMRTVSLPYARTFSVTPTSDGFTVFPDLSNHTRALHIVGGQTASSTFLAQPPSLYLTTRDAFLGTSLVAGDIGLGFTAAVFDGSVTHTLTLSEADAVVGLPTFDSAGHVQLLYYSFTDGQSYSRVFDGAAWSMPTPEPNISYFERGVSARTQTQVVGLVSDSVDWSLVVHGPSGWQDPIILSPTPTEPSIVGLDDFAVAHWFSAGFFAAIYNGTALAPTIQLNADAARATRVGNELWVVTTLTGVATLTRLGPSGIVGTSSLGPTSTLPAVLADGRIGLVVGGQVVVAKEVDGTFVNVAYGPTGAGNLTSAGPVLFDGLDFFR